MALSLKRTNRILEKIKYEIDWHGQYTPNIRQANAAEGHGYVIDRGSSQALNTYDTIPEALAVLLDHLYPFDTSALTDTELQELKTVPSQCVRYL